MMPNPPSFELGSSTSVEHPSAVIADLSYRGYDGPINPPTSRWWAIAGLVMRLATKKRGFWGWSIFSAWYFVILLGAFYFAQTISPGLGVQGGAGAFFGQMRWTDQFITAFSYAQIFLFILALLFGVGAIANDNRANALLVYLSKPCSKADYVLGKWLGIAGLMFLVVAIPNVLFYFYCLLSFREYGFWSQDPWLLLKLIVMSMVPAVVHASLSLGISSLFNQGRIAGATYAAIYFILYFITTGFNIVRLAVRDGSESASRLLDTLVYGSVDGLNIGMAKIILGASGGPLMPVGRRGGDFIPPVPSAPLFIAALLLICVAGVAIAWTRVRAVEVVGG